ncbi:hypothetical protein METHB2_690010 [Candidatus Methylobacter favarea]|uniref:ATP-binding protein n=1 Tax=Candidatus Methylobacter favarea TaxID=2707345 RepID=A0A8S0WL42_9GAMM|nr:ATP-binding protein [Candidatus Methylobacter favarea]CAA9892390.1 hypothetical protein METHB2_690010 [Candidatus Methylobacter favarea]
MNQDELLARLQGFEWNDFECKKAQQGVPEDAYKTGSAFANIAGGWIVFGISDHNGQLEVSGVAEPDKVQNDFLAVLRGSQKLNRVIRVDAKHFTADGKHVFAFHIPECSTNEKPIYLKGDPRQTFIRRGAGDEQCTPSELERFLCAAALDRYDGMALSNLTVATLIEQVTPQVVGLGKLIEGEMSRQSMMNTIGIKDRKHFDDAYLQPALDAGLLTMTLPDKPNSSKQRYRLTPLGAAIKAEHNNKEPQA